MTEQYPDDIEGANNALGFDAKFPLLEPGKSTDMPMTLPRVLPRDRQAAGIELRLMSFNIWNGGLSGGHPLEQTAKAILASGADVAGLQGKNHKHGRTKKKKCMPAVVSLLVSVSDFICLYFFFHIVDCRVLVNNE